MTARQANHAAAIIDRLVWSLVIFALLMLSVAVLAWSRRDFRIQRYGPGVLYSPVTAKAKAIPSPAQRGGRFVRHGGESQREVPAHGNPLGSRCSPADDKLRDPSAGRGAVLPCYNLTESQCVAE